MRDAALVIANPAAGNGRGRHRIRLLEEVFAAWPTPPRLVWSRSAGHVRELARAARRQAIGTVIAAGGDGTVHEVVNGLLQEAAGAIPCLAYLPVGTSCDFARSLGLPRRPTAGAAASWAAELWRAPTRRVDLGLALLGDAAGEWFVNAANAGLGAGVASRVAATPALRRLGSLAYAAATLAVLPCHRSPRVTVTVDGRPLWRGPALNVSVCNGAYFGGGMRPVPAASLSSGRLHVAVVHPMAPPRAALELARVLRGAAPDPRRVTVAEGIRVELAADGVEVEVDGEVPGSLPGRFEAVAAALAVRVPGAGGTAPPD